jgi:TRAP-type C4-dicarboxylate transport system permease small subunit
MQKILDFIYGIVSFIMICMLLLIVGSISVNVFSRFFGQSYVWVDELSRIGFVWLSLMAIIIVYSKSLHARFDAILLKSKGRTRQILLTIIYAAVMIFLIYALKGGITYVSKSSVHKTAVLGISVGWTYVTIPIATFIMSLETINKVICIWKKDGSTDIDCEVI